MTKAVILAGGRGTRLGAETQLRPKPMVEIGGRPILWHIMKLYAAHGITDFIICLGYKGQQIKEYFLNYRAHSSDLTLNLATGSAQWITPPGEDTQTGGRLRRIGAYLKNEERFCLTYGDGVADIDLSALLAFHAAHGRDASITAVVPPGRFGALDRTGVAVRAFTEKPPGDGATINGGFFVLSPRVLDRIDGDDCVWEQAPLRGLAADDQLRAFDHRGFWHPMDTPRDRDVLEGLWQSGAAPWKQW